MTDRDEKVQTSFLFNVYPGDFLGPFKTLDEADAYNRKAEQKDRLGVVKLANILYLQPDAALSRPAMPAEPTFREIRPEEVTFGRHRDVPSSDEVEAIRARHDEACNPVAYSFDAHIQAHADRATLLRLLDAARAALAKDAPT